MGTLGEANVRIRATMEDLDKDLSSAKSKIGNVLGGIGSTMGALGNAGFGAFAGAANLAVGAIGDVSVALFDMAKDAVQVEGITNAFNGITAASGQSGEAMLKALQQGSNGTIAATNLMQSYNKAAQLVGTTFANELPDAMGYLTKVAAATGQDMGYMMDSLVTGIGRLSPMILDNLGIQVNLTEANEAYAATIGKTASELTKQEQQTAMTNMVMQKLKENTEAMPDVTETAATKFAQFQTTMANLKTELGVAFMPVLLELMSGFSELASGVMPLLAPLVGNFAGVLVNLMSSLTPLIGILSSFAGSMTNVFNAMMAGESAGVMVFFTAGIKNLASSLGEVLPGLVTMGVDIVVSLVQGISAAIPVIAGAAGGIITTLVTAIVSNIGIVFTTGISIITNLVDGVSALLPTLIPLAMEAILNFVSGLVTAIPSIYASGAKLMTGLFNGIAGAIPILVSMAPTIITGLVNGIIAGVTLLASVGFPAIISLVDGIMGALPLLLPVAVSAVTTLVTGFLGMIPMIISTGASLLTSLITGIVNLIPTLISTGLTLISTLVETIIGILPLIVDAGVQLILALVNGLIASIPQLIAAAPVLISAIVTAIIALLPQILSAGVELIVALISGIVSMVPAMAESVSLGIQGLVDIVINFIASFADAGANIVQGIREGIAGAWSGLVSWFTTQVSNFVDVIRGFLKINSPSKVFAEIGKSIPEGMALGIDMKMKLPQKEVEVMLMSLVPEYGKITSTPVRGLEEAVSASNNSNSIVYNLTANYKRESEITLTEQVRILNLLGGVA